MFRLGLLIYCHSPTESLVLQLPSTLLTQPPAICTNLQLQGTEMLIGEVPASISSPQLQDLLHWFKQASSIPGVGEDFSAGDPRCEQLVF